MKLNEHGQAYAQKILAEMRSNNFAPAPAKPQAAKCPVCDDQGSVKVRVIDYGAEVVEHPLNGKFMPCPRLDCREGNAARARIEKGFYARSGIPEEFRRYTFATWETQLADSQQAGKVIAYYAARAFASASNRYLFSLADVYRTANEQFSGDGASKNTLVFFGEPGMGKSGLAAAVFNALKDKGRIPLWRRLDDMFIQLYKSQQRGSDGEPDFPEYAGAMEKFIEAYPLFIDEANVHNSSPARMQWFEDIIRTRLQADMPTVITMNLTPDDFREAWGERTFNYLRYKAHWIEVKGECLRTFEDVWKDKP